MLLIHANILTMDEFDFQDGFIQIQDGIIQTIGDMIDCPVEEHTVDLKGATVLPGFIDAHTHLGMWENGLGFEGDDGNEETDPITPQLRALDAINPLDYCIEEARHAGITTVLAGPGSANPISGSWCAFKTFGSCIDDMAINSQVGMKFSLGENPKSVYNDKSETPMTRMATAALIREELAKAKRYHKECKRAKKSENGEKPEYDTKCEALRPLFKGEMKAFFHAHRADDIFTALRIAREFSLDLVLIHATEGHKIADTLADAGIPVIAGPLLCDRSKPELREHSIKTPAQLVHAGVTTALCTDHPVTPIQYLPLTAAIAVKGGLSRMDALRAMTIVPAEICGIDYRVGSLIAGKDADLCIFCEDPLSVHTTPVAVMINGKWVLEERK